MDEIEETVEVKEDSMFNPLEEKKIDKNIERIERDNDVKNYDAIKQEMQRIEDILSLFSVSKSGNLDLLKKALSQKMDVKNYSIMLLTEKNNLQSNDKYSDDIRTVFDYILGDTK